MHDLFTLTKLLFKANYKIDIHSKKGKQSLLVGFFVFLCILPSLAMFYMFFHSAFSTLNLDLMILQLGFSITGFLVLWIALFMFPSVFYFSNDLNHLLVLPVSPTMIIFAKFIIVYISLFLTSLFVTIPMLAAYIIAGANIVQILAFIIQLPFVTLVPAFIVGIFWIIVFRFIPFFKNKDRFNLITGVISIIIAVSIGAASGLVSGTSVEDPAILLSMLQKNPETLSFLTQLFFNIPFATRAIVNISIIDLALHLVIICITGGLFYLCSKYLYLISATNAKGSVSKRNKKLKTIRQTNPFFSYLKIDFYKLMRTPAYFSNCVLSGLVAPIIMIVVFMAFPEINDAKTALASIEITQFINLPLWLYLGGLIIGFFFGSLNGISATAFSREGKNISFMLYIPFDFSKQLAAKVSLGIFFSVLSCILLLIPVHMFLTYPIYYDIAYLFGTLLASLLVNFLALLIDGIHPKTNWEDETSAIKNNLNVVFEFLASWAIIVVVCAPFFLFNIFDHLIYYTIFVSIIFILIIIIMYIFGPKLILRYLKKGI